jgi:hypothetical protein
VRPGERISRINAADVVRDIIISAELAAAVDARGSMRAHRRPEDHRQPRHLFSGLMRCVRPRATPSAPEASRSRSSDESSSSRRVMPLPVPGQWERW